MFGKKTTIHLISTGLDQLGEAKVDRVPVKGDLINVKGYLCRVKAVIFCRKFMDATEVVVTPVKPKIEECFKDSDILKNFLRGVV